jgi:putative ABC transport system substrate-binding protein
VNPDNAAAAAAQIREAEIAASSLGLKVEILKASTENNFEKALAMISQQRAQALLVGTDGLFLSFRDQLISAIARHNLPALYDRREYVKGGGLISYGIWFADYYRLLGVYAGRVLNGARPAELPVQRPSHFELAINLNTARTLALEIPPTLLARADEVIE